MMNDKLQQNEDVQQDLGVEPAEDGAEELDAFHLYDLEDYHGLATQPRRRAREVALMLLFALDMGGHSPEDVLAGIGVYALSEENQAFVTSLVKGAWDAREDLDAQIGRYAREWALERLAAVDRAVLRLALYEMRTTQTPTNIIMNEAIELVKKFSTEESGSFVNGILDSYYRHELASQQTK